MIMLVVQLWLIAITGILDPPVNARQFEKSERNK